MYNVGGREEWAISIEELADIILQTTGAASGLVDYREAEDFTTRAKIIDFSKARRDLNHDPQIDLGEGICRYVAWVRRVYDI